MTVFKKTTTGVVKLLIPQGTRRTACLVDRKCRAESALVLEAPKWAKYQKGEVVKTDNYDDDIRLACTGGIDFFLTREEAEKYH